MGTKKPLAQYSGSVEELRSGDALAYPFGATRTIKKALSSNAIEQVGDEYYLLGNNTVAYSATYCDAAALRDALSADMITMGELVLTTLASTTAYSIIYDANGTFMFFPSSSSFTTNGAKTTDSVNFVAAYGTNLTYPNYVYFNGYHICHRATAATDWKYSPTAASAWTSGTAFAVSAYTTGFAKSATVLVAFGTANRICYSTTGTSFTMSTITAVTNYEANYRGLYFSTLSKFILVTASSIAAQNLLFRTSTDGVTFTNLMLDISAYIPVASILTVTEVVDQSGSVAVFVTSAAGDYLVIETSDMVNFTYTTGVTSFYVKLFTYNVNTWTIGTTKYMLISTTFVKSNDNGATITVLGMITSNGSITYPYNRINGRNELFNLPLIDAGSRFILPVADAATSKIAYLKLDENSIATLAHTSSGLYRRIK